MASRCSGVFRAFSRSTPSFTVRSSRIASSSRRLATAASSSAQTDAPPPPSTSKDANINRIVDDIAGLTLLQAADLVSVLKSRLNIQEIAMPAASAAPAAAAAPADEPAAAEKPAEKTIFNVKLESFDAASKAKVIREVKAMIPNLTLIDAKKFVESLPQTLKENLPKEDAEKMQKTFEALGAVVKLD
ncbi:54S ribosomal protein L12, mitochondrial [Marasmius tenuissimus]|uniref:54S ribosomal protein L12, mitochondrial n=1 Tax=Marasmius tenuissimus TaxID=585030 RepID=A0ABR2ZNF0_9AGAR|nr:54S ribosomal protein L12, mitochondrial [Marasmius tenuissimus]